MSARDDGPGEGTHVLVPCHGCGSMFSVPTWAAQTVYESRSPIPVYCEPCREDRAPTSLFAAPPDTSEN